MSRAIAVALAFVLAGCAHLPTPTPLPPQDPEDAKPVIIFVRDPRPIATPRVAKKPTPIPSPTPDVVAIGWALRDTLVWDGRSASGKAVRRTPRRNTISERREPEETTFGRPGRRATDTASVQCGYRHGRNGVGFSARACRRYGHDARSGRCRRNVGPFAVTTTSGPRGAAVRAGCRRGSPLTVISFKLRH